MPEHLTSIEPPPFTIANVVHASARKNRVDPAFVNSIIKAESSFNPEAVSPVGALGLMQLMPETAAELGYDPEIPEENIQAGTQYLGWLMARYKKRPNGTRLAIAAYNAGPGSVDRYRGVPPFAETQSYVKRVMGYYADYRRPNRTADPVEHASIAEPGD